MKEVDKAMLKLLKIMKVLSVDVEILRKAFQSDYRDKEDAVQYFVSKRYGIKTIVTQNIKDFKKMNVEALLPSGFIKKYT